MAIQVRKPTEDEKKQASRWPIWTKEASTFPWRYDSGETCYMIEGEVLVKTAEGAVAFGAGDWVVFPKGLECTWVISKPVRKHYSFG
ncbi:MAG: cupin domain-containing protein [Elusimicrobia bacterium]|nr:cupin domain-containing protein [Elusimicrobiota bacterium]